MQDRFGQFCFARTIATNRVDVDTRADHVVGQDRGICLVSRACRDDMCTLDGFLAGFAGDNFHTSALQVRRTFCGCSSINVIQSHLINPNDGLHCGCLKFGLCPIADHGHDACAFWGQ